MHLANTAEILASVSDSMESDPQQTAELLNLLVFHPDPEEFDYLLREFD
jgi:hypothetical protein